MSYKYYRSATFITNYILTSECYILKVNYIKIHAWTTFNKKIFYIKYKYGVVKCLSFNQNDCFWKDSNEVITDYITKIN